MCVCVCVSHSVVSNSLLSHGLSPGVCSISCPLSQWCCLTISFSAAPFSFCLQSFPAARSFTMSHLFTQVANVLELQLQHQSFQWIFRVDFLLDWLVWSPKSKGLSRVFSSTTIWKHQFFGSQPSLWFSYHIHTWLLEKPQLWLYQPLSAKWFLLFNTLSRFAIAFLPRSKHLNFMLAVIICSDFGAPKNKVCHCFHFFPLLFAMK